ncbi:MAG: hypothetical protein ACM3UR_09745 [Bacteroidota bacterium]|jgi:hypothetical protein|nr:hypothetical protein [Ignavibacteria bacterium]MCU7499062.1 hypothetical protein [Ignavibacteria bacterium]MCU7512365.1 hypothetical protein [Ignavibacteria bacterium]MCU7522657.1 hypothetical protein [Ignavibacteria bacterium]MCU7526319.1 hypothetical protein [Ignavibacteria bacterium]
MENTLKHINSLVNEGIILKYAIGGGIASLYYLEATVTFDLDVMVILSVDENSLWPLKELYEWARKHGFPEKEEHIVIDNIPVQFLPAYNDLVKEAVENAKKVVIQNAETYIITPEYLIAIMLQTGRGKDKFRVQQFFDEVAIDKNLLNQVLEKYSLKSKLDSVLKND